MTDKGFSIRLKPTDITKIIKPNRRLTKPNYD